MLTSAQIRGARGFLNISQMELAKRADISFGTVQKLEQREEFVKKANFSTLTKIKDLFKKSGIQFIEPKTREGFGEGIRFMTNKDES